MQCMMCALLTAEAFVNELSSAFFQIHEPDRESLKEHLSKSGISADEIRHKPFKFWKDRWVLHPLPCQSMCYKLLQGALSNFNCRVLSTLRPLPVSLYQMPGCRCRRRIPDASEIIPALEALMGRRWADDKGESLLTSATPDAHKAALRIIESGRLSGAFHAYV